MHKLTAAVLGFIKEHGLIEENSRIIAGISGGMDSVCLFYVLSELREILGFKLSAVHAEHGIRGESSLRDEAFVKKLCQEEGIELKTYKLKVPEYARSRSLSLEEAARKLRYEAFRKALAETGADKIAVAHHKNDQAETLLFNLIRGSGLSGLSGMRPERDRIIRPLLCATRQEIEEYIGERGLSYATDESNADDAFSRNRLRLKVIPELEKICAGAVQNMSKACEASYEALKYIEDEADRLYARSVIKHCEGKHASYELDLRSEAFLNSPHIIRSYAIKRILSELAGSLKDITSSNIEDLLKLTRLQSGRRICLPYGMEALKAGDKLLLYLSDNKDTAFIKELCPPKEGIFLNIPGITELGGPFSIECTVSDYEPSMGFPESIYTKWFDYDKIKNGLCLRSRLAGDSIAIDGNLHKQALKKYLINEKVPVNERDSVPLLADGSDIVWVIGKRMSAEYRLGSETQRVLKIKVNGGNGIE